MDPGFAQLQDWWSLSPSDSGYSTSELLPRLERVERLLNAELDLFVAEDRRRPLSAAAVAEIHSVVRRVAATLRQQATIGLFPPQLVTVLLSVVQLALQGLHVWPT